jgi:hypothetical protein
MTKFSDQLFTDLMNEHGPVLAGTELTASGRRHPVRRAALVAGGAGTMAVALTAGLTMLGGGASPAYAVTKNPDGTLTVAVSNPSGIAGANATLHAMGVKVYVVPVQDGCPSMDSLPKPILPKDGHVSMQTSLNSKDGSITVNASGIPAGDILVLAVSSTSAGTMMAGALTTPPPPSCVSLPPGSQPPAPGTSGQRSGHRVITNSNGAPGASVSG